MRRLLAVLGVVSVAAVTVWNYAATRLLRQEAQVGVPARAEDVEPAVVEREQSWGTYLRGVEARFGDGDDGLAAGLARWTREGFPRGYADGNETFVCPFAPRSVRVHQAGHTPAFGEVFAPIQGGYRPDGGLGHEPLPTFDVMVAGRFPRGLLRFRDRRDLGRAYDEWLADGRLRRVSR